MEATELKNHKRTKPVESTWLDVAKDLGLAALNGAAFAAGGLVVNSIVSRPAPTNTMQAELVQLPKRTGTA